MMVMACPPRCTRSPRTSTRTMPPSRRLDGRPGPSCPVDHPNVGRGSSEPTLSRDPLGFRKPARKSAIRSRTPDQPIDLSLSRRAEAEPLAARNRVGEPALPLRTPPRQGSRTHSWPCSRPGPDRLRQSAGAAHACAGTAGEVHHDPIAPAPGCEQTAPRFETCLLCLT